MTWRWPWFVVPERWRVVALTATALLLGWIGLNQMGMPVGAPWTPKAEQSIPFSADNSKAKAAAEAEAQRKAQEAQQQRLAAAKAEEERKAKAAAEAEAEARAKAEQLEKERLAAAHAALFPSATPTSCSNPNALGVSRVVEIDTTDGPGFGFEHF